MAEIQSTRSAPVFGGIDIARHRHEVLIEVPGRKRRRRVTMLNIRAVELLSDQPDYRTLCTIPGSGPIHALTVPPRVGHSFWTSSLT